MYVNPWCDKQVKFSNVLVHFAVVVVFPKDSDDEFLDSYGESGVVLRSFGNV